MPLLVWSESPGSALTAPSRNFQASGTCSIYSRKYYSSKHRDDISFQSWAGCLFLIRSHNFWKLWWIYFLGFFLSKNLLIDPKSVINVINNLHILCVHKYHIYTKEAPRGLDFLHQLLIHLDFCTACSEEGSSGLCLGFDLTHKSGGSQSAENSSKVKKHQQPSEELLAASLPSSLSLMCPSPWARLPPALNPFEICWHGKGGWWSCCLGCFSVQMAFEEHLELPSSPQHLLLLQ